MTLAEIVDQALGLTQLGYTKVETNLPAPNVYVNAYGIGASSGEVTEASARLVPVPGGYSWDSITIFSKVLFWKAQ